MAGRRLKAAERRASILAVARVLFADQGYHGVSVDDIARRLGVSPAVLYRHFESKAALYEAVLEEMTARRQSYIDAALAGPDDFGSVLRRMAQVFAANLARDPDYLRMEMQAALEGGETWQRFFRQRWKSFTDYIEEHLRERAREGHPVAVTPVVASTLFQGMMREALYAKCVQEDERFRHLEVPALVDQLITLFLRAIGETEGAPPSSA